MMYMNAYKIQKEKERVYKWYQKGKKAVFLGGITLIGIGAFSLINLLFPEDKPSYVLPKERIAHHLISYQQTSSERILTDLEALIEDIHRTKKNIQFATDDQYDSLAMKMTQAIAMSNILQERSYYEQQIQRFSDQKLGNLYQNTQESFSHVSNLPLNVYTQELKKGETILLKHYDLPTQILRSHYFLFDEGGGLDTTGPYPEPKERKIRIITIEESHGVILSRQEKEITYDPQKRYTLLQLINKTK